MRTLMLSFLDLLRCNRYGIDDNKRRDDHE